MFASHVAAYSLTCAAAAYDASNSLMISNARFS